jgi:SNF2 family DNA or RNA helicase
VERVEALLLAGAGPVVVFSDHVDSAKLLAATLEKKYRVGLVHGEVDLRFRQAWVDGFQTGKLDALVATIPALKEGVTLTRGNRLVYNDLPWEPASLEQSAKRIHRIGQTRPCFVDIIALTGMDAMIARTLARKMSVIDKILSPLEQESRNAKPCNFTARS